MSNTLDAFRRANRRQSNTDSTPDSMCLRYRSGFTCTGSAVRTDAENGAKKKAPHATAHGASNKA